MVASLAGRDCSLGALQRERKATTAALKALRCSASGGGVDFAITIDLTEQQLGRCPKPHKGRCPLTLQGTLSLDPFARLTSLSYFFRVLLFYSPRKIFGSESVHAGVPSTSNSA